MNVEGYYYKGGKAHREDSPAVIKYDDQGYKIEEYYSENRQFCQKIKYDKAQRKIEETYYCQGKLHRTSWKKPSVIKWNEKAQKIEEKYYWFGQCRNYWEGPAIIEWNERGEKIRETYYCEGKIKEIKNLQYITTDREYIINGICYTKKEIKSLLIEVINNAFKGIKQDLIKLSEYLYQNSNINRNKILARYLYKITDNKNIDSIYQYKILPEVSWFIKENEIRKKDKNFREEDEHLKNILSNIKIEYEHRSKKLLEDIYSLRDTIKYVNYDERRYYLEELAELRKKLTDTEIYKKLLRRPYYARMDLKYKGKQERYYIGEENFGKDIISVWSSVGAKYRAKTELQFDINNAHYEVLLRRTLNIQNGVLKNIFDEYVVDSENARNNITDPYLIQVLEEKRGEINLTNIIRTIQINQNNIIDYDFKKNLIVQGCAGSGKTMILLHRLANMKYNMTNLDLKKIKIITPNKNFNLFIDDLSKNLHIEDIDKISLCEYYVKLLVRYYKYTSINILKEKDITKQYKEEINSIRANNISNYNILEQVYSNKISEEIKASINRIKNNKKLSYKQVEEYYIEWRRQKFGKAINQDICSLYLKLLFMYYYYGVPAERDEYLCIDEGQDIPLEAYKLLRKINGEYVKFNIYGDLKQVLPNTPNIEEWKSCANELNAKVFKLEENYRNSDEIIHYYNNKLNMNDRILGVSTKQVEAIHRDYLRTYIKFHLILKNRVAIISNQKVNELISESYIVLGITEKGKASLLTVKEAKGLEFDVIFVIETDMTKNERYIAYTRGLSELYIVE